MYTVFVGGISPEGEHLLNTYLKVFMPDAKIEPLKAVGIKGKMKNHAKRQDVALVIIDESLYQACVGVADDVLALPKVHKYTDDESLNQFLISKFGRLDGVDVSESNTVIPPDELMQQQSYTQSHVHDIEDSIPNVYQESYAGSSNIVHTVVEDSYDNLAITDEEVTSSEKDAELIADLQDKLSKSEMMVHNLTLQLEDKSSSSDDDIKAFVSRIHELETQLEEKDKQLASSGEESFVQLGKVARAEQIIKEFDDLKGKLKTANEDKSQLEYDKTNLSGQVDMLHDKVEELKNQIATLELLKDDIKAKDDEITSISEELSNCKTELTDKSAEIVSLNTNLDELKANDAKQVEELQADIANKVTEITNLTTDLDAKKVEIEDLHNQLTAKGEELENALAKVTELSSKLDEDAKAIEAKEQEINDALKLSSDSDDTIKDLNTQINSLSEKISSLETMVSARDEDIASKTSRVEELEGTLTSKDEELAQKDSKVAELESNLSERDSKVAELEGTISEKDSKVASLESDLSEKLNKITELEGDLNNKDNEITQLNQTITEKSDTIEDLQSDIATKDSELRKLREVNDQLSDDLSTNKQDLVSRGSDVESLNTELSNKSDELEGCRTEIANLNIQIEQLKQSIVDKDTEITNLTEANNLASDSNDVMTQAIDKVKAEKDELENKFVESEENKMQLEKQVEDLQNQITELNNTIAEKDANIEEVQGQCNEFKQKAEDLQSDLINSKADNEVIQSLEKDLSEERRKSAKLTSEVEVLRKTNDSEKTSELRLEIARLKNEVETAKNSSGDNNSEELEICKNELQSARERCAELELDMVDKDSEIKELSEGVFGQMANIAMPKAAYDSIKLKPLVNIPQNFYCVTSGSTESIQSLYALVKKSAVESNKRILFLDLATDSYIDSFGIPPQGVTSPTSWLEGSKPFKDYVATTRYPNIRILTTALAYLNDISLLNVNWQKCLNDLNSFGADAVVVNIGCLSNIVTKVLFNTFSQAMTSYVVVKATPANLRASILNLSGIREVSHNATVTCVNFDNNASKPMYQRLTAKYKAQILGNSDILKL